MGDQRDVGVKDSRMVVAGRSPHVVAARRRVTAGLTGQFEDALAYAEFIADALEGLRETASGTVVTADGRELKFEPRLVRVTRYGALTLRNAYRATSGVTIANSIAEYVESLLLYEEER